MGDGNGHNTEDKNKVNHCPFMDKECIKDKCALYTELIRNMGGLQQKYGTCNFNAVVVILSEINQKADMQQQIQLPKGLLRG